MTDSSLSARVLNAYASAHCQKLTATLEPTPDGTCLRCTVSPTAWVWLPMLFGILASLVGGVVMSVAWVVGVARGESIWDYWWAVPSPFLAGFALWQSGRKRAEEVWYLEQVLVACLDARREESGASVVTQAQ